VARTGSRTASVSAGVNGRSEILPTYRVVDDAFCALPSSVGRTEHCANQPEGETVVDAPVLAI
jgi:hypothetical protein